MKAKYSVTPWFNAQKQPPVRVGTYERRCGSSETYRDVWDGEFFRLVSRCKYCQWRGLTRP